MINFRPGQQKGSGALQGRLKFCKQLAAMVNKRTCGALKPGSTAGILAVNAALGMDEKLTIVSASLGSGQVP